MIEKMAITSKEVEYLSHLARLQLTPEELQRFAPQLEQILKYVEMLKAAPTHNVPPTTHVLNISNVFREDKVTPSLPNDLALSNAPAKEGPFFKVPKVIESA
jgi:aspartyl-tRNA(Asn)/glutamyl-tRNA(Gln) amidotransferase subunit C